MDHYNPVRDLRNMLQERKNQVNPVTQQQAILFSVRLKAILTKIIRKYAAYLSYKRFAATLLFIVSILFTAGRTLAQEPQTVLPFQQDAMQQVNEEQLAIQFFQARDFGKAAGLFEQIYEKKPSPYIYQYYLLSLVENQDYGKAERVVRKNLRATNDDPRYMVDLGYIYGRKGDPERARKIYDDALKKLKGSQQQIFDLANAFISKGENEYAVQTYLRGRQLMNNSYPFGFELAVVYERMGDFKNATGSYLDLLEFNASYLNTVEDRIQSMLSFDINNEKNEIIRKEMLAKAQRNPDKIIYAELLWWYSIQQKDFDLALIQAKALDRRMNENGDKLFQLASLSAANQQFDIAIECYQALVDKGRNSPYYDPGRRELINTKYRKIVSEIAPQTKELNDLSAAMVRELKAEGEIPENITMIRNLAHLQAFYLNQTDSAVALLNRAVEMPGVSLNDRSECKIELADIYLFTGEVWEASLLYQQVYQDFKNDVLGQEAKFRNTKLSFYIGEFKWAGAQADVLKAATSKFISNDAIALSLLISENYDPDSNTVALEKYARAELFDFRNDEVRALASLDSIITIFGYHPILPFVLYKKSLIKIKQGQFTEADTLLATLVRIYPEAVLADEALMKRGELNRSKLNNPVAARACYQQVIDSYPASVFVPEARRQFRILRGDNIP